MKKLVVIFLMLLLPAIVCGDDTKIDDDWKEDTTKPVATVSW